MNELIATLQKVDTGEYNGIGARYVALGEAVDLPDDLNRPRRDSGLGFVGKYLATNATETAAPTNLRLTSPLNENTVVDTRVLSWLLIGRERGDADLASDKFIWVAGKIITDAIQATDEVAKMPILQGAKRSATDWRSLFEGFVKAGIFGPDFQPNIITSLGGYDGPPPLAAAFNVIPGLELLARLKKYGFQAGMTITSAYKYAVRCNGFNPAQCESNWDQTRLAYQGLERRYLDINRRNYYETLEPSELTAYPDDLLTAAAEICKSESNLRATAEKYGADEASFLQYMLSHIQAFGDYQPQPKMPFVIKVGAPSEQRFSRWQKRVMEKLLPDFDGYLPNQVIRKGDGQYGQISLYYPRIGRRPPYYPEPQAPNNPLSEPQLYGVADFGDYQEFLDTIDKANPALTRYANLGAALEQTSISPLEYLQRFSRTGLGDRFNGDPRARFAIPSWAKEGKV